MALRQEGLVFRPEESHALPSSSHRTRLLGRGRRTYVHHYPQLLQRSGQVSWVGPRLYIRECLFTGDLGAMLTLIVQKDLVH